MRSVAEFLDCVRRGDAGGVASRIAADRDLVRAAGDHGKTGLHWAAELDRIDVARVLVDAGSDIEARTSWGATPLQWAATMGSARVAEFLLSRGATGYTLSTAAALGRRRDVEAMAESGAPHTPRERPADPGAPSDEWPPDTARMQGDVLSDALYAAARNGHTDVVEYLLSRGASVDAKGYFGATALHWAAIHGHAETVELLVARGASLELKDARFDATAAGWAEEGGHPEIAARLRRGRGGAAPTA